MKEWRPQRLLAFEGRPEAKKKKSKEH